MSITAITASVWGQGRQAIALSAQAAKRMGQGEEECHICRDDVPATISFVPCKHKVCFGCVENMRAKNIFKADKGIKCPFCRQYVDGYQSILPPNPQVQQFLAEANKAAHIAAQARYVAERKTMQQQGFAPLQQAAAAQPAAVPAARQAGSHKASAISGEDQTWNCGSCATTNYLWREFCSKCKKPTHSPYGADKMSQNKKDIGSMSRSELVSVMHERGAYGLRRALMDMGVTVDGSKSYGSTASVRDAVAMYGLKRRMLHIAELLADAATMKEASLHYLSNLAVQRVLEALAKLRQAFPPSRLNAELEEFKNKHNGKDPLAVLLAVIHPNVLDYCLHEKGGVYVIQCAATVCSNTELVALGRAICPLALPVCRDPKGVFVLRTLLDLFGQRIWEDEDNREPALKCVDLICQHFLASEQQLLHTAMHALSGKVLVRAVAVSMPRFPALQLAVKVACCASMLAATPGGLATLTELLQLYGHNQQAMEGLRDIVACMCYSLQGNIKTFALQKDESAQEFLLCLVERLGVEQEVDWLDSIAQELVGVADQLLRHPAGLEVLKFTLTQPVLDLDTVTLHISDLKTCLGKTALVPIVGDIMERVAQNPPLPAPKYPAASVIQPELRYYLNQGCPTPLPPPPPPKPGDPGYEEYAAAAAAREEAQMAAAAAAREAREAAIKARREAAAARQADAGSSSSTAVLDAWSSLRAADVGDTSSAWESSALPSDAGDGAGSNNDVVTAENSSVWGSSVDGPAATTAGSNPWNTTLQSPGIESGSSRGWGNVQDGSQSSRAATPASAAPSVPSAVTSAAASSVPLVIPVAVPIAVPVPVPIPRAAPLAAPAPAAVPVASPVVPSQSSPAAAAAPSRPLLPPVLPRNQQQQHPAFGSVAVADFNTAAPARLNPGVSPSLQGASWQQPQQQRQQLTIISRPSSATAPGQQQFGQQEAQAPMQARQQRPSSATEHQRASWACSVCTYEHTGAEAQFLFCAMCSSQRPADS